MKKILFVLSLFLIIQPAMAKNVKVEAMSDFSTANPPNSWKVKVVEGFVADNGKVVNANTVIEGKIMNVRGPKRLKQNATFRFVPQTYYEPASGEKHTVKRDFEGKYSSISDIDAKKLAQTGAITAGNMLIGSFVAPTVGLVEGVVKNEKGNRAKSAVVGAYERTPLSYANKGKDIEIKKGQRFTMSFKLKGEPEVEQEDKPNYSYEIVNE